MSPTNLPFSRPVVVASLPDHGLRTTVEATAAERAALAEVDGIPTIESLSATFDLMPRPRGHGVAVRGEVVARVWQTCSVSLELFESALREPVDLLFLPAGANAGHDHLRKADIELDLSDEDPPEVLEEGRIDLGAIAAEFLALGLDPYPRKPGVSFETDRYAIEKEPSPFAALAGLKKES